MSVYETGLAPGTMGFGGTAMMYRWGSVAASSALTVTYILWFIAAMALYPAAQIIYWLGVGGLLIDVDKAYSSNWDWWRIFSVAFISFAPPIAVFFAYQERKITMEAAAGSAGGMSRGRVSRAGITVLFYLFEVFVALSGLYLMALAIYMGIKDIGECSKSPYCSGTTPSNTPGTGIIMALTALCFMAVLHVFFFFTGFYIHAATRGIWALILNRLNNMYAPLSDQIGEAINSHTAELTLNGDPLHVAQHLGGQLAQMCNSHDTALHIDDVHHNAHGQLMFVRGELQIPTSMFQ